VSRARLAVDPATLDHLRPGPTTRRFVRILFVIVLVAVGLTLPSIPPTGRSVLVWIQREAIRLSTMSDQWREEQTPSKAQSKSEAGAVAPKPASKAGPPAGEAAKGCRGGEDVLATVPHREHYQVLAECITVVGTVRSEPHSDPDGVVFDFTVDPHDSHLFASDESEVETGQSHQRPKPAIGLGLIVPADLPGCKPGEVIKRGYPEPGSVGTCSGLDVVVPPPGTEVKITGAFVFDRENKLHVICPVWSIEPIPD
jgi:hypothetical protein